MDFEEILLDYFFYSSNWPQHAVQQVQCSPFVRDLRSFITWLYSIGKLPLYKYIPTYNTPVLPRTMCSNRFYTDTSREEPFLFVFNLGVIAMAGSK